MKKRLFWQEWKEPLESLNEEDDEEDGEKSKLIPVMSTDHGLVSLKISAPLKSDLVFWVGNTNFDIGKEEKEIIINTDGVEIFSIFSPYRFRVGIGLAFNPNKVKLTLKNKLCGSTTIFNNISRSNKLKILHAKLDLKLTNDNWAMFVLPNGEFSTFTAKNKKELDLIIKDCKEAKKEIGGTILMGYK